VPFPDNGALTIARAPLTLTYVADAASSIYGQPLAGLSGSVSESGLVNGESIANLAGRVHWATTAAVGSPVGPYAIIGGGLTSSNYAITAGQAVGNGAAYGVSPRPVTVIGLSVNSKVFDGSTNAFVNLADMSLSNLLAGDQVALVMPTASFSVSGPGVGIPVTVSFHGLSGASASNYALTSDTMVLTAAVLPQVRAPEVSAVEPAVDCPPRTDCSGARKPRFRSALADCPMPSC
jgi:hypothetical protein